MFDQSAVIGVSDQPQLGDQLFATDTRRGPEDRRSVVPLEHRVIALELSIASLLQHEGRLRARVEQLEARTLAARWVRLSLWVQTVWGRLWR